MFGERLSRAFLENGDANHSNANGPFAGAFFFGREEDRSKLCSTARQERFSF
jgi:hypothetical protein